MAGPGLTVRPQPIEDHPDTCLVSVQGSIEPGTLLSFKERMQALVADGTRRFILDCEHLTYINSSGMAYLINLAGEIEPEGGTVALASLDPKIRVIFKMMGLLDLFTFYPTFAEALEELKAEEAPAGDPEEEETAVDAPSVSEPLPVVPAPRSEAAPATPLGSAPRGNLIFRLFRRLFRLGEKVG